VGTSTTTTFGAGGFATVAVGPVYLVGGWIIINPGADGAISLARQELALRDIDGDGFADQLASTSDGQIQVARNLRAGSDLLSTITGPLGSTITLTYARDGNTFAQPQSRYVLASVQVDDGHPGDGPVELTKYQYQGGVYNRVEREFYGYGKVIEQEIDTTCGPLIAQCPPLRTTERDYRTESYYSQGLQIAEIVRDATGHVLVEDASKYAFTDTTTNAPGDTTSLTATIFPALIQTTEAFFEQQSTAGITTSATYAYDEVGRVVAMTDAADGPDDATTLQYVYQPCDTHVFGPPIDTQILDAAGNVLRHGTAVLDCLTGEVTQTSGFIDLTTASATTFTYFANGNVQSITGPPNAAGQSYVQTFAYDTDTDSRITSVTDSFGYVTTAQYDPLLGAVVAAIDANGQKTTFAYDAAGRLASLTTPLEQGGPPTVSFEYHPEATPAYAITRRLDAFRPGTTIDSAVFVDGLGRVIQAKEDRTVFTGTTSPATDVVGVSGPVTFDAVGRVIAALYPTTEARTAGGLGVFNTTPETTEPPTQITYDALDRVLSTTLPDKTRTTTAFAFGPDRYGVTRFQATETDANGFVSYAYRDVRGLTRAIEEFSDGGATATPIWTSYVYDPVDQITQVTDDQNHNTLAAYDLLGRRTAVVSPDSGTTELVYDLAGNLTDRITPNLGPQQKSIHYKYDFTRLTDVVYPSFPDHCVHYEYGPPGAPNNAAGRITVVHDAAGSEARAYDALGDVSRTTRFVDDDPWIGDWRDEGYVTQFAYDSFGRLGTLTYPDGEVLTYAYDSGGDLARATGVKWGLTYDYVDRLERDAFGAQVFYKAGNGVQTAYTYDPASRRLASLQATTGGHAFQGNTYGYDNEDNVTGIANAATPPEPWLPGGKTTQSFTYDRLYRLTGATGTYQVDPYQQRKFAFTQQYDSIHNIRFKQQTDQIVTGSGWTQPVFDTTYAADYDYDSPRPHAPTRIGDRHFFYDLDGNQIGAGDDFDGPQRRTVWDDEDRLDQLFENGGWQAYAYDDLGDRMVRTGLDGKTVYANEYLTVTNGAFATKHVFAGDVRVASKRVEPGRPPFWFGVPKEDDQVFYHFDHNGNVNFATDAKGNLNEHREYFPFGETWIAEQGGPEQSPYLFAGKELDPETGLYYFGARYYDARDGVWLSADPLGSASPYGYASQSPIGFGDLDGRVKFKFVTSLEGITFTFGSGKKAQTVTIPVHPIHLTSFKDAEVYGRGGKHNIMRGGFTVLTLGEEPVQWGSRSTYNSEGGEGAHTEKQFFGDATYQEALTKALDGRSKATTVIVIELVQNFSPCAACQNSIIPE
jgi:RHS repeat-associated protein